MSGLIQIVFLAVATSGLLVPASLLMAQPDQRVLAGQVLSEDVEVQARALQAVAGIGRENVGPELRSALIKSLERENTTHTQHRLADQVGQKPPPLKAPEMYFEVAQAVIDLHDRAAIPALAGALGTGTSVPRALAEFGLQAVPALLDVVTDAEKYCLNVNGGLLALRFIVEQREAYPLPASLRNQIIAAARQRLATGKGLFDTTLLWAIDLAVALKDPELQRIVESISSDRNEVIARGITDPQLIEQTQKRAHDALSGVPMRPRR